MPRGGAVEINVNGKSIEIEVDAAMPLLWVLRDMLDLTGTKFGCGIGACGACTALVDGNAVRTCVTPVGTVAGRSVRTIEELGGIGLHALQQAWIDKQVPQCGYCQSGMLMAAAALLAANPNPSDAQIDAAVNNICRCGTYQRVRAAIRSVSRLMREGM